VDDAPDPDAVLRGFALPGEVTAYDDVVGGWSNRVLSLTTTRGRYAVKVLRNPWGEPRWIEWLAEGWRLELAARDAGVALAEPVPVPATGVCATLVARRDGAGEVPVRVHHWVDGVTVPRQPVTLALAHEVGGALAAVHALDLHPLASDLFDGLHPTADDAWPHVVARARECRAAFADALAEAEPLARRASALCVDDDRPTVLSHGDVDQKNLLVVDGRAVLIDWDVVAPVVPAHDLARAALTMASWRDPHVARALVDGYAGASRHDVDLVPTDLGPALASRLRWIRFTVDRHADAVAEAHDTLGGTASSSVDVPDVVGLLDDLACRVDVAERLDTWLARGAQRQ
jgi:aminoglycoside phosphotransferase (APT) family kinase protein